MFTIVIQEKGGEQRRMVFNKPEVTIGRVQGNDIVLPKGNVSKRHARIVLKDGKFIIVDLKSTNGTYVNGRKITSPLVVKDSDKIYIGDFIVGVDEAASGAEGDGPSEATTSPPPAERLMSAAAVAADLRPPRPTEAQPMPGPLPIPMSPMAPAEPAPAPLPARTAPPRQPPGPTRDLPGRELPPRDLAPRELPPRDLAPRDLPPRDLAPRDLAPRDPAPTHEPRSMSPLSAPSPGEARARAPLGGRPGGTMPPPLAPIPSPLATPAVPPPAEPPVIAAPAPAPTTVAPVAPAPAVVAAPNGAAHAPIVPLPADKARPRALVGAGARRAVRSVSMPSRRGVQIEPLDPKLVKMLDLQSIILERLRAKLDLDKVPLERLHEEELWQRAERVTIDLVETLETSGELPKYIDQDALIKETLSEALALGPLEDLLADDSVDEIVIDRRDRVVVGKDGELRGAGKAFSSEDVFERVVKRLVAEAGGRIDEATPVVDLRMRDGTRLTAAIAPVAARGACLVLKKPASPMPQLADLGARNTLSPGMADFLATCVAARRNMLVCGGPGAGKTTVVAAVAAAAPVGERVISIEEAGELSIARDEWIQLETRAGVGKSASVDLAALLETALRLAPDRLVVGEVRGNEALPLVHALTSSVDGAVVAMTGDDANLALSRLALLARTAGGPDATIRELVAQAFDIVVHVARWTDGSVRVMAIEEVVGYSDAGFETQPLFQFRDGSFVATGTVPRFYAELEARGIPADQAVFR